MLADFKAAFKRFQADEMSDRAAALTYYSLMSLFPALLFAVALLGVFGQASLINDAADYLTTAGAPRGHGRLGHVRAGLRAVAEGHGPHGAGARPRALAQRRVGRLRGDRAGANRAWRVEEGRGFARKKANDLMWTLVVLLLVIVTFVLVFLGGGLASDVLGLLGLGETAADVWRVVRWPAALASAMLVYAVVYYAAPNVEVRRFQWITPGAVFGVLTWILASALFFVYVSNFSSYSATYGAFAAAVILLVWLWLTNVVLLFGAELNAAIDVRRSPDLPRGYEGPPLPAKVPADSA